jgi:hypothetical protein
VNYPSSRYIDKVNSLPASLKIEYRKSNPSVSATGERFNSRRNGWEPIANMHSRRSTHEVCSVDGFLYAVGGNDGSSSLNSVEVGFRIKSFH